MVHPKAAGIDVGNQEHYVAVPPHLDGAELTGQIDPDKDVDGLTVANAGRLALGLPGLRPCTPVGVMVLLAEAGVLDPIAA